MPEKKQCPHPSYIVKDGQLVCTVCGEPSPRVRKVGQNFIHIGDKPITCPKCGTVIQVAAGEKSAEEHEDKMLRKPEDKKKK